MNKLILSPQGISSLRQTIISPASGPWNNYDSEIIVNLYNSLGEVLSKQTFRLEDFVIICQKATEDDEGNVGGSFLDVVSLYWNILRSTKFPEEAMNSLLNQELLTCLNLKEAFNLTPGLAIKEIRLDEVIDKQLLSTLCAAIDSNNFDTFVVAPQQNVDFDPLCYVNNLTTITLPLKIARGKFKTFLRSAHELKSLTWPGTVDQWKQCDIENEWFVKTKLHEIKCLDGVIPLNKPVFAPKLTVYHVSIGVSNASWRGTERRYLVLGSMMQPIKTCLFKTGLGISSGDNKIAFKTETEAKEFVKKILSESDYSEATIRTYAATYPHAAMIPVETTDGPAHYILQS